MKNIWICGDSILRGVVWSNERNRYITTAEIGFAEMEQALGVSMRNRSRFGITLNLGMENLFSFLKRGESCDVAILEYGGNDSIILKRRFLIFPMGIEPPCNSLKIKVYYRWYAPLCRCAAPAIYVGSVKVKGIGKIFCVGLAQKKPFVAIRSSILAQLKLSPTRKDALKLICAPLSFRFGTWRIIFVRMASIPTKRVNVCWAVPSRQLYCPCSPLPLDFFKPIFDRFFFLLLCKRILLILINFLSQLYCFHKKSIV